VLLDNAGRHVSERPAVPPIVVLHRIPPPTPPPPPPPPPTPPHTPELQPVESLWPLVRAGIADRTFDTLGELEGEPVGEVPLPDGAPRDGEGTGRLVLGR
jgi:hypothetical protein